MSQLQNLPVPAAGIDPDSIHMLFHVAILIGEVVLGALIVITRRKK